ncbi:flagellar motor protein MotB [Flavobacterium sp. KMS]|uniref:OmpA family protein n=1 Tax=Flavobacterium sp. KMS TaxID=1566023 RepID=UPI0005806929|nr:OmpA family protein [Flavobacterium sp. KMS]KIA97284.1 flagellar motor protein MotB [Flavobacterium sp. KMS]
MKLKLLFIFLFSISIAFAQKREVKTADKNYDQFAYIDAIKVYENIAGKGYKSTDLFQKLGNAYYFNGELAKAEKWYTALFDLKETIPTEYYYRYAQSLKAIGDYKEADAILDQFSLKSGQDSRAQLYNKQKDYLEVIKKNSGRYTVENAGINSEYSDYGTSFLGNQLVFTSARDTMGFVKRRDKWTNQSFTNLYTSIVDDNGNLSTPKRFSEVITTHVNESTPVFTKDGKTMYFTRNNFLDGKNQKSKDKTILLKIYRAVLKDNKWTNIVELPFNSNEYSVAHPALSPDEKTLYFASNMPETKGDSDIFKVSINADGSFGTPENLGDKINTEGKETFPFISEANELYFASNGHPGLGGLDIFVSPLEKNNTYQRVFNIGAPVNSSNDDFAFWINSQSKHGFFSTNREETIGYDDIFKLKEKLPLTYNCDQELVGIITDDVAGTPLANVQVQLFDSKFNLLKEVYSNDNGAYTHEVVCEENYYVRVLQKDYETKEVNVTTSQITGKTQQDFALSKKVKTITTGDDLAKVFGISNIHFELDKSDINPIAEHDLAKIIAVMNEYPTMKVDIRSHTDSRASIAYNQKLSEKRAQATMKYMIKNGIDKSRLTAKGYGESQLINGCNDGVSCTEEQHLANRRSEFIINMGK